LEISLYDEIILKNGKQGTIVEIYGNGNEFIVDILIENTGEYPEYETEAIKYEDIKWIIKNQSKKHYNL